MTTFPVSLVDTEIEVARLIGGLRGHRSRDAGGINTPYGREQSDLDIDACGAELAFCKLFNVFPDLTSQLRVKGCDCLVGAMRVDVKNTSYSEGRLIARRTKAIGDVELYVLVRGRLPNYECIGWCFAKDLIRNELLQDLGDHGAPCYVLENENLRDLVDLVEALPPSRGPQR